MKLAAEALGSKGRRLLAVGPDATVSEAVRLMNEEGIGAILVRDGNDYTGIWTERDLLRAIGDDGFDPAAARLADHMTTPVVTVRHDEPLHKLKDKFLGLRLRHLLVEEDGAPIGLLSAGDVMRASLIAQADELASLNRMVSWEYYEAWGRPERARAKR